MVILEWVATFFGVLSVYLLTVGRGLGWPLGCVWIVLTGYVYWDGNILGSASLQLFFLLTQLLGWWRWQRGNEPDLRVSSSFLSKHQRVFVLLTLLLCGLGVAVLLEHLGSRSVWMDSFATVGSVIAQALMVGGNRECWLVWLAVNLIYVALNFSQQIWGFFILYALFCGLSVHGWRQWTRDHTE